MEYNAISTLALSNCSGGTLCRPVAAYMASNSGSRSARTVSTIFLMRRIGWSGGIMLSGVRVDSIVVCGSVVPRMLDLREDVDGAARRLAYPRHPWVASQGSKINTLLTLFLLHRWLGRRLLQIPP